ncbi:MAG: hypothetical protein ACFFCH_11990 [Promethearchaeota archaeon]
MERNKLTIVILVSAFVIFFLVLSLKPSQSANTDSITPTSPSESVSKCWSPPGKDFTKSIAWQIDCWNYYYDDDPATLDYYYEPLVGAWIYVEYFSYECGTGHWIPVGWYLTDCTGEIDLCGPTGDYRFTWVKEDGSTEMTCMNWSDTDRVTCCKNLYCNYLTPKGGDKAILFSLISVSPTPVTHISEMCLGDRG